MRKAVILFNLGGPDKLESVEPAKPATVTKLPLTLLSIFASDSNNSSAAIISQRDQQPKSYKIKDTLPGNAILIEILKDKVILLRAGNREVLSFPKISNSFEAIKNKKKQTTAAQITSNKMELSPALTENTSKPRKIEGPTGRFPSNNKGATEVHEPKPQNVTEIQEFIGDPENLSFNEQGGMIVDNGINDSYLRQTGLQEGDIVLSVNGRPASSIGGNKSAIQSILAEGAARIEIQRGSRRFIITASIPR